METEKMKERFTEALRWMSKIIGDDDCTVGIDVRQDGSVRINCFPNERYQKAALKQALKIFGKLEKSAPPYSTMEGEKNGVKLVMFNVVKCEITGYKTKEIPEMVESGRMVETHSPIYKCTSVLQESQTQGDSHANS